MKPFVLGLALSAVAACTASAEDSCEELRSVIAYDDPGPWRATPEQLTEHVAGPRTGTLLWAIGSETTVTVNTTLDTDSATAVDRIRHEGDPDEDRLACSDSIVMTATLEIATADGGLQETLRVELEATQGTAGGLVDGWIDLSNHDFAGPLSWRPGDDTTEVFLRLRWTEDQRGTLNGWLVWGDSSEVEVKGSKLIGKGVSQVIAQFETTLPAG
jgi:hypothetical protein